MKIDTRTNMFNEVKELQAKGFKINKEKPSTKVTKNHQIQV